MSGSSLAAPGEQSSITTGSFPRVFKEFDFLEAEHDSISESTESCFNWLSTMRQPRCSDENAEEEVDDALTDELEDDFIHPDDGDLSEQSHGARLRSTVAQRGLTGFMGRGRRPLSAASDSNDISSDRTPIQSEKHSDESCPSCPASDEEYDEESDRKSHAESRPVASTPDDASSTRYTAGEENATFGENTTYANAETASSVQCRSEFSVRQGSSELIAKPPIYLECSHHTSGRVEHAWMSYVTDIANDQDGELTAHSVLLLSQLLRESSSKLSGLLRDASHLLTTPTTPQTARSRDIATYFTHALHAAMRVTDCPFVFITAQFLRHSNLLQSEKFCLYELREHFETFSERREQCIRALNTVKSAQRFLSLNASQSPGFSTSSQEVELCKALHKLFFQLHQMLEKLLEMIRSIQQAPNAGEYDLSPAVISLQRDLLTCLSEVPPSESRTSSTSLNASRSDLQTDSLVLHLTNKNYKSALVTLRQLR
ncbi:Protein SAX-2 b [Aphelenchoides avenae]|nr:Protein SAX-2 b [Aphelenchus avenae]